MGDDALEQRKHLAPVNPPGQTEVFAHAVDRQIRRSRRDERLIAIDREIRRERDIAVLARSIQVQVAKKRAIEELRQKVAFAVLERQTNRLQIPAVLPVP